MLPGNASSSPLPLRDRIMIALDQLRQARAKGDPTAELAWEDHLDSLIDRLPRTVPL